MRFNGTTIPTHRDETYDTSEVSRYGSSGSGGIDVESLNVTENGTYIAPDGKAYSPVNVDVAGGGSSDFSTAIVTFISNSDINCSYLLSFYDSPESEYHNGFYIDDDCGVLNDMDGSISIIGNHTVTQSVFILNNKSIFIYMPASDYYDISVSGNAENLGEQAEGTIFISVTGDCTITIS